MTDEPAKPHKVRADPHHVMAWVDGALGRRGLQLVLILQLVVLVVLLLGPRLWGRESLVARLKVGERAEGNIKAPKNFDYFPSPEQLERERAAATAKVLPVFDHKSDVAPSLLARVGRAFDAMTMPSGDAGTPPNPKATTEKELEDRRLQFANLLQAEVSPEVFAQLSKANFSTDVRASLLAVVGSVVTQYVVGHRSALHPFKEGSITIRHLVAGRPSQAGEEKLSNLNRIRDLQELREELKVQAAVHLAKLPPALGKAVVALGQEVVMPNLAFNQEETQERREAAREAIQPRPVTLVRGQVIIRDGDPITKEDIAILRALESWNQGADVVQVLLGMALFVVLLVTVHFRYATRHFLRFLTRPRDLLAMSVLLLGILALAKFVAAGGAGLGRGQELPAHLFAIPVAGGAMLVRLLISAEAAALFAGLLGTLCGMLVDQNLGMMVFYSVTGLTGAAGVTQVQSRSTILRAGLAAGLTGGFLALGLRMFREQLVSIDSLHVFLAASGGGVLAAFMTLALLPAMEWLFAYTTDVTLLELANLNHPLLRELILRAPGTYHHSMVVGSLSETACESIGANGLLARVACYYHDAGKMRNADYFAENFKPGENPHNRLKPSMSSLIIRSHVKDTVEMLREHRVPELVIDTATQHHGQTLIEFFYHKAVEHKEPDEEIREEEFRYPGPKPQSREAGVIMLADGVEAAARSLAEPTEDRLRAVVQRVINNKFTDGQLDHCDLTLRDLHSIAKSFLQVLRGIYHQRPTYPWQQQQQGRRDDTRRSSEDTRRDTMRVKPERGDRTDRPERSDLSDPGTRTEKATAKPSGKPKPKQEARGDRTLKGGKAESRESGNGKNRDGKESKENGADSGEHRGEGHKGEGHKGEGHRGEGHRGEGHRGEGHRGEGHRGEGHKGEGHKGEGHKGEAHKAEGQAHRADGSHAEPRPDGREKAEVRGDPHRPPQRLTRPTGPMQPVAVQLASPASGTPDAAAGAAPELAESGNPDIKRLGLS